MADLTQFILPTKLENTDENITSGNKKFTTCDLIFLDSEAESESFGGLRDRLASPTDYALANGASQSWYALANGASQSWYALDNGASQSWYALDNGLSKRFSDKTYTGSYWLRSTYSETRICAVLKDGKEILATYDSLWIRNDIDRAEIIANKELDLTENNYIYKEKNSNLNLTENNYIYKEKNSNLNLTENRDLDKEKNSNLMEEKDYGLEF